MYNLLLEKIFVEDTKLNLKAWEQHKILKLTNEATRKMTSLKRNKLFILLSFGEKPGSHDV